MAAVGLDIMDAHLDPVGGMGHHLPHWYGIRGMSPYTKIEEYGLTTRLDNTIQMARPRTIPRNRPRNHRILSRSQTQGQTVHREHPCPVRPSHHAHACFPSRHGHLSEATS
jgi:hypothetical protein